jgi:hypothetical protein
VFSYKEGTASSCFCLSCGLQLPCNGTHKKTSLFYEKQKHKQEGCNLVDGKEQQHRVTISNRFAALENLDNEVDINRA